MSVIHKDLTNKDYVSWKQFLSETDAWDVRRIREFELSEIKRVVEFAYKNTSGYKRIFDKAGIKPDDIKTLSDYKKIPFLTKEMIRDNLDEFSTDFPNRFYVTTGGSTGIPMGMYRDPVSFAKELASKAHQYHRVGWKEGDRQIVFRGLQIDTPDGTEFLPEFNELRCSTYEFGTDKMEIYRRKAMDYKPDWVRCYPSSGYIFARYLKDSGKPFPKIKGILCASEQLYDFQKQLFQEVFGTGTTIFTHYGHYEMAAIAGYCEYTDDYHVLPQYGYVELLDKSDNPVTEPGATGEIVATSFIMHATPFIRYRTRDLAVFKSLFCEKCNRQHQIWERVEGRSQELIVSKKGRLISTTMLNMHNDTYDHLRQFQFHQREIGKVIFRFIEKPGCNEEILKKVKRNILGKLGEDIELVLESVEEIPLTKRGKHRVLIQELDLKFDHPAMKRTLSL
ncbi:MAG: phenylacetate--CoA ligase family protein [Acidobacteria bacterium]|nr:phenylacetate--CoA ligase family protein [Acidobacteriota bacterium]